MTETQSAAVPNTPGADVDDPRDPAAELEALIARVEAERADLARLRAETEAERGELVSLRDELAAHAGRAPAAEPAAEPAASADGPVSEGGKEPGDGPAGSASDEAWALPRWDAAPASPAQAPPAPTSPAPVRPKSSVLAAFGLDDADFPEDHARPASDPSASGPSASDPSASGPSASDPSASGPTAGDEPAPATTPAADGAGPDGELRSVLSDLFDFDPDATTDDADAEPGEPDAVEDFAEAGEFARDDAADPVDDDSASGADGGGADSVAAYMENLLSRMRQSRGEPDTPARKSPPPKKPAPEPAATATPVASPRPAASAPPRPVPPPEPPRPVRKKVDKEELRRSMAHLRSIANTSARTAVAESSWRKLRGRLGMDVAFCLVLFGVSMVLLTTDVYGRMLHAGAGGAAGLGALWLARDAGGIFRKIHREQAAKRAAAKQCAASTTS